jgi:hypothetical protein
MVCLFLPSSEGIRLILPCLVCSSGGPGCSGLVGFFTEMGPWRPIHNEADEVSLIPNPFSWNLRANLVYLEQPVGVGFSYEVIHEKESEDVDTEPIGDQTSVQDMLTALVQFFVRYPERKLNDVYLASESYGGHYIPELAQLLFDRSDADTGTDTDIHHLKTQLRGLLIGNPLVSFGTGIAARGLTFWNFQLIPRSLWVRYETEGCADMDLTLEEFSESCWEMLDLMFQKSGPALDVCESSVHSLFSTPPPSLFLRWCQLSCL